MPQLIFDLLGHVQLNSNDNLEILTKQNSCLSKEDIRIIAVKLYASALN
jgi:hypothetical protein